MQPSKLRFNNKKKKRWPLIATLIIVGVLVITSAAWLGMHDWNLDKSLAALNTDAKHVETANVPKSQDEKETAPKDQHNQSAPAEDSDSAEAPAETPAEQPEKPAEKPSNNVYAPNQVLPDAPTVEKGFIVANKQNPLPEDYNKGEDPKAREAFEKMAAAARLDGFELVAFSTFRSYDRQVTLYNQYVAKDGQEAADRYSARPGYSEHQTGLAFDIGEKNFEQHWASASFGDTPAGKWVAENAHRYGFIMRYPLGKEDITGYMHESWHFRYVGVGAATDIYTNKITLEEYLGLY